MPTPAASGSDGTAIGENLDLLLRGQQALLQLVGQGAHLSEVLKHAALLVEQLMQPALCAIQLPGPSPETLCYTAAPNLPRGYVTATECMRIGDQSWPAAVAAQRRAPIIIADLSTGSDWPALQDLAVLHGLRACSSHPLIGFQDELLAVLTVYHRAPRAPSAEDLRLLDALLSIAAFAISHDKRERARQGASERFTSLAATIPGVVYQRLVKPDGEIRYTYISEGARDLFGVPPEEILADPQALFDCHGPEYSETFRERLLEASRQLQMWDVEAQIITRDGEEKWTHAIARPRRQADGSVLWDGVILDATRKKKAEIELRKAKEAAEAANRSQAELLDKLRSADQRFASLAATIPGVVYQRLVTPDGDIRYTYISEGARDVFGVSPEEILADPQALFDCHGPEYRATFRERLLEASRDLRMWDVEAQIISRDGEEKWTHAIARPRRLPDGSVLWDGIILDATRIKKVEMELRKAKEAAEESSRAKTGFLSQISHELRTPLNAIIGFSQILVNQSFGPLGNERYIDYAEDVNRSGVHLLEIINDILEFTKFETGALELAESDVMLERIVDAAINDLAPMIESSQVDLVKRTEPDLPIVIVDQKKIKHIIQNLLSNAIKFTPQRGRVEIATRLEANGDMAVSIADNGIGIRAEDMAKVYEVFGQIDNELSRRYEGTGLGVPLAIAMAELHGASITFDSQVGVGTTVTLVLPKSRILEQTQRAASA